MKTAAARHVAGRGVPGQAPVYRYGLVILFLVCTVSYLDRQIVTILAEPIKRDLQLSDTQLGLLTGFAFGIVYCVFGVPIARLADRVSRLGVLGGSLIIWSLCTVACGLAPGFGALVAARMGVGIGESGSIPTGLAVAADYAPREKRASALAFFAMGTPVGSLLGLAIGGILASAYGWRSAFLIAGIPGIPLAVLILATLRPGPYATPANGPPGLVAEKVGFAEILRRLIPKRSFWLIAFGAAAKAFIAFGQAPFLAPFFLRTHAAEIGQFGSQFGLRPIGVVGIALGLLGGIGGSVSNWLGGALADYYGARDVRAYGTIPAIAALLTVPFSCAAVLAPSALSAFGLLVPVYLLSGLWFGPGLTCIQGVVARELRATATSMALFIVNMVGFGFGSLAVGGLSDLFQHRLGLNGADGVRWALVASSLFGVVAAGLFWRARRYIRAEVLT